MREGGRDLPDEFVETAASGVAHTLNCPRILFRFNNIILTVKRFQII